MKVIYIAGKYRGPNAWAIEQNIRAAEDVAARVAAMGHMPMVTQSMTRFIDGANADEQFWVDGTLEIMRRCDAVVLVPNWRDSEGARAEVAEAERLGLPVFGKMYFSGGALINVALDELAKWVADGEAIEQAYKMQCEAVQA